MYIHVHMYNTYHRLHTVSVLAVLSQLTVSPTLVSKFIVADCPDIGGTCMCVEVPHMEIRPACKTSISCSMILCACVLRWKYGLILYACVLRWKYGRLARLPQAVVQDLSINGLMFSI